MPENIFSDKQEQALFERMSELRPVMAERLGGAGEFVENTDYLITECDLYALGKALQEQSDDGTFSEEEIEELVHHLMVSLALAWGNVKGFLESKHSLTALGKKWVKSSFGPPKPDWFPDIEEETDASDSERC